MAIPEAGTSADLVYRADCPSRPILDQIADKWSMMVMAVLNEPRRFNEIKRRLEGVTQRVLTQTLRRLERDGLVQRTVYAEVAGRVCAPALGADALRATGGAAHVGRNKHHCRPGGAAAL